MLGYFFLKFPGWGRNSMPEQIIPPQTSIYKHTKASKFVSKSLSAMHPSKGGGGGGFNFM